MDPFAPHGACGVSVYFVEAGPYMKVGYSADPTQRIESVTRTGARPADLPKNAEADLIGWVPGDRKRESELHRRFAHIRVESEWFWSEREAVLEFIWSDPSGVDVHGMSALAAITLLKNPSLTRDDVAGLGIPIKGVSEAEALDGLFRDLVCLRRAS